jgi:hypothetical protein
MCLSSPLWTLGECFAVQLVYRLFGKLRAKIPLFSGLTNVSKTYGLAMNHN